MCRRILTPGLSHSDSWARQNAAAARAPCISLWVPTLQDPWVPNLAVSGRAAGAQERMALREATLVLQLLAVLAGRQVLPRVGASAVGACAGRALCWVSCC
eukprot:jgi/Ulvmu1/6702/UM030_0034.1